MIWKHSPKKRKRICRKKNSIFINFYQVVLSIKKNLKNVYSLDLQVNPKGIIQIFEFIDLDHVEILFGKLQIKFNKEEFEKYTTYISKSEQKNNDNNDKHIEVREQINELKDKEKKNLDSISKNIPKGKLISSTAKSKELTNNENGKKKRTRKEMAKEKIKILFNFPSKKFIHGICKEKGYKEGKNL
jgi:hypothetical protein